MSYPDKAMKLIFLTVPLLCLCSCDYRALAKENKQLEQRKAELTGDLSALENDMKENPDDSIVLLEQAKVKRDLLQKKRQQLQSTIAELSNEHKMLIKKNHENERDFIIKW